MYITLDGVLSAQACGFGARVSERTPWLSRVPASSSHRMVRHPKMREIHNPRTVSS